MDFISSLVMVWRLFGSFASNFLVWGDHLFGWSVLDYATFCPTVFSAVVLVAFAICNGPSIVTDAVGLLRGGLRIVSQSTIKQAYTRDGVRGVVRLLLATTRAMIRQSWVYRVYCWLDFPIGLQVAAILLSPVLGLVSWYNFFVPLISYVDGVFSAFNNPRVISVFCNPYGRTHLALGNYGARDVQLFTLFCEGERDARDIMTGLRTAKEAHLYNWEMFQPTALAWVLFAVCLATFVSWMAARPCVYDFVSTWFDSLTDMFVPAEPIPDNITDDAKVGTSVEPESTGNHAANNDIADIIDKLYDMAYQLIGQIRNLKERVRVAQSTITHLKGQVLNKDQELVAVRKTNADVHAGLSSSLALAQGQVQQEKVENGSLRERFGVLRQLAGIIADQGLYQYLLGFDKLELGCDGVTPGSGASSLPPNDLHDQSSEKVPTLLKDASAEACVIQQSRRDEWHSLRENIETLERKQQERQCISRSLTVQLTQSFDQLTSEVDKVRKPAANAARASVDEVRATKDKEIETLREQLRSMQYNLGDRTQEVLHMDRQLLSRTIQLSESRDLVDKTTEALSRAEEEIKSRPVRDTSAEEHIADAAEEITIDDNTAQLQQELADSDARARALEEELAGCKNALKQQQGEFAQWQSGMQAHAAKLAQERDAALRHNHDLLTEGQKLQTEVVELRKYRDKMRKAKAEEAALSQSRVKVLEQENEIQGLQKQLAHVKELSQGPTETHQTRTIENLRTRVQAFEVKEKEYLTLMGTSTSKVKSLEEELRKIKISQSNKTTPIANPRMVKKPNPLQGKVDALQKELEFSKSQLVELTKERDDLAEAVRSQPGSSTEPVGEGNPPKTSGKRRRDDDGLDEESAPKRHK